MMKKNEGLTLIELVLALAITMVLLALIAFAFPMVFKITNTGNDILQGQNLAQMKLQMIESKLQYATSLEISSGSPVPQEGYEYIYLEEGKIYLISSDGKTQPITPDNGFSEYDYTLDFSPVNDKVLKIDLKVMKDGSKVYGISTQKLINNLGSKSIAGLNKGDCVAFKRPDKRVSYIEVQSQRDTIDISGQTLQFTALISPNDASNKSIAWSVDNDEYAFITQDGLLTPLKNTPLGSPITVKAMALDGSEVYGEKKITITNQITKITGLKLKTTPSHQSIWGQGNSIQISAEIEPENASDKSLKWTATPEDSNEATVSISDTGVLTVELTLEWIKKNKTTSAVVRAETPDGLVAATIEIYLYP